MSFTNEQMEQLKALLEETIKQQNITAASQENTKESNGTEFDIIPNQNEQPMQAQQLTSDLTNLLGVGISGLIGTTFNGLVALLSTLSSAVVSTQALSKELNQSLQQMIPQLQQGLQQAVNQKK